MIPCQIIAFARFECLYFTRIKLQLCYNLFHVQRSRQSSGRFECYLTEMKKKIAQFDENPPQINEDLFQNCDQTMERNSRSALTTSDFDMLEIAL